MANNNIEFKAMPGQVNVDEAQGIVECFVAGIGNKDSVGDVLVAGAFAKSLQRRKPRVVWGHNWNDPIGKVLEIYEVPPGDRRLPSKMLNAGIGGLYARVQFNLNSEKGREAFANVAFFGQEQEWSIGYKTLDAIFDPNIQANVLKEVELYEVSPVLHGANQLTGTISVKSDELALAEEEKGWGMMGQHHMMGQMPMKPNVIVIREDDDDDDKYESEKPIFSEGLAQPISGGQRQRLEQEIMERTGSQVRLVEATENTAVFQRMMPNGTPMTFRIGYHTPDNYSTFMFGKPELVNGQNKPSQFDGKPSGSRVVVPSQMPMMPMQVKPGYDPNNMVVLPKSDLSGQLEELEDALMEEINEKVGKTINKRNLSKLKSILENLQDVIASAEKEDMDTKGYLIPVQLESAFHTKSILDPIFDYHRVESVVTEDGILITSGVTKDLVEAIDNAQKGIGRSLGGGLGKGRAAGRAAFARFDPNAWDGDGDGLVQEGTPFQRPAIPGVNDRATGGKVNARRAIQAYQGGSGFASSSKTPEVVSDRAEKVDEIIEQLAKNVISKGRAWDVVDRDGNIRPYYENEYNGMLSTLQKMFSPLSKEKVKDSPGKAASELRKNLVEKLSDEDLIEQFDSREQIDKFIGSVDEALAEALTERFLEIQRTGTKSDIKEFEDLSYEIENDFRKTTEKIAERAKNFWAKRTKDELPASPIWGRSEVPLRKEEAVEEAREYLDNLLKIVKAGLEGDVGGYDDFADWLGSRDGNTVIAAVKNRIRSGEIDAEDLQYELEMVLEYVQNLDPTMEPESLVKQLQKALKKGGEKNPKLKEIADSWGDDEITGGDLIDELRRIQKDSKYRPDRGKNEREILRGFASRSRDFNNIGFDRDDSDPGFDDGPLEGESADKVLEAAGDAQEAFQAAVLPSILDEDQWGMLDAFAKRRKQIFEKLSPAQRKRAEKETAGMSNKEVRDWMESLAENDDELMDAIGTTAVQGMFDNEISFGDEIDGEIYDRVLQHAEKTVGSRARGRGSRSRRGGFASAASGPKPRGEDEIRAVREMAKAHPELSEEDLNQMAVIARIGNPEDITPLAKRLKISEEEAGDLLDEFGDRRDRTGKFGKRGGFASAGRMDGEEDGPDYDEAFGPRERRPGRGMQADPVGEEVADRLDRDEQNRAIRQGFASSGSPVDYDEATGPSRGRRVSEIIEDQPIDDIDEQIKRRNRQQRAVRPEWQRRAEERRGEDGFASTSGGGKEKLESDYNQVDMTLEEYGEIQDSIDNIIKKLEEGDFGADDEIEKLKELTEKIEDSRLANDMIPLDDEELTDYLGMLEAMRDGGVGMDDVSGKDKDNIDSLISALKEAQKTGSSESQKLKDSGTRLSIAGRSTRSQTRNRKLTSDGTLTPAKKLSITLDDDTISLLIEEADLIADNTKDRQSVATIKKILQDAKGGKFEVTPEQFDSVTKAIEDAFENGLITSDIYGVLHQAAENPDGKYDINDFIDPPKPKKGFASTSKINNGAPSDITESMQKEFIFWARRQRGLRIAQSIVEDHDRNGGQLKASQWKALRTMYGNMGPGSGRGGFASNVSQPTAGFRDVTGPQGSRTLPYVHQTSGWKKVGGAGGLNEASVMQDPKTGKKYYVKHTRAGEEFRGESEILTSKLYQLLGIGTINYERGIHNGKLQRVSEWNPAINSSVDHSRMSRDPGFRRSMQGTLIANAWLANWDGTGNMSNIVELNGQAVMADSGGGLLFRAQRYSGMKGQGGTDTFGPRVEEVWNLIHGTTRGGQRVQAGVSRAYYSDITPDEVARQVKELGKVTDDDIKKLVAQTISNPQDGDRLAQILIARRDWIVDHWGTGKFVEKPSDTSRSDSSGAKARPFASVSSRSRGFASSSIDGPGDDTDRGRSGVGARGVGQMIPGGNMAPGRARREGERNRAGTEVGAETRFAGKKFEEVKPDNWDELTLDEKWQWATTYGNPENAENKNDAMSVVEYRKLLNGLMEEEDKADLESMTPAERRAEQRRRAAEKREMENMGFMPEGSEQNRGGSRVPKQTEPEDEDEPKALKVKKTKNAEDAKKEREARLDGILEAIEKYRSKFNSDESENDAHRDIWDSVSDSIQEGGFDFTIRSLDKAIADLDEYIGEYEDEAQNSAERLNLKRARALRKQLASARAGYAENPWIVGGKTGGSGGFASSSGGIQSAEKIKSSSKKLAKDIKTDIKKLQGTGKPGTRGFASTSSGGKTMITDEATFFRDVETSLDKEIRRATKAGDKRAVKGLSKLAEIIRRDEASKTGSRRTNVGSIYFTMEEADEILDGLMFALDTQLEDGGEKRVGWYSRLIDMIAKSAKSTFIDKTTKEITETTRTATNSRGQKKKINIVPEA